MLKLRKIVGYDEKVLIEGGKDAPHAAISVRRRGGDRQPLGGSWLRGGSQARDHGHCARPRRAVDGRDRPSCRLRRAVEGYGKAALCGTSGEIEHASALIHTLHFGNHFRRAVGAKTYLAFTNVRGGPNTPIMIPLMDKLDEGRRSHYLTVHFAIPDAPAPDELVIALGASIGGRPHHRIGDRYQDLETLKDLHGVIRLRPSAAAPMVRLRAATSSARSAICGPAWANGSAESVGSA